MQSCIPASAGTTEQEAGMTEQEAGITGEGPEITDRAMLDRIMIKDIAGIGSHGVLWQC